MTPNAPATPAPLFRSTLMGGIECSSHRRRDGHRLDVIAAQQHDRFYAQDYARFAAAGLHTIRSGIAWHTIERRGRFDFSAVLPRIRAAHAHGLQVIWDVCHYGWPDDLDIWRPAFVDRLARLAGAFARVVAAESDAVPFYAPVNEISFWAWGGGDVGYLNPFAHGRGFELKVQLARAAIAACDAIWAVDGRARIVHTDPVLNIMTPPDRPDLHHEARGYHEAQYQGWDLLAGRLWPQIGGAPQYLDVIGMNYYPNNQWFHGQPPLLPHDPAYRPFRHMAAEVWARYERPLFVAETGTEGPHRPHWLRWMVDEMLAARRMGVPLEGLCLYPVIAHPGWDDDRHTECGLWDYADATGHRPAYAPLAAEMAHQQRRLARLHAGVAG